MALFYSPIYFIIKCMLHYYYFDLKLGLILGAYLFYLYFSSHVSNHYQTNIKYDTGAQNQS